jgi:hypothetical protein
MIAALESAKETSMPIYEIEVTRLVEFKGHIQIEAEDPNEAYAPAKAQVDAGHVALEQIYDHTDMGPIRMLGPTDAELEEA